MAQGMKFITDDNGHKVSLDDLCFMLCQGFGDWAVKAFIRDRQRDGDQLSDVRWVSCHVCEDDCPVYEDACLICATSHHG